MRNKYAIKVLGMIASVNILAILALQGCASDHQLKSYVSVEKPPMKMTYIDYSQDISPDDVDRYIRAVSLVPYHNVKLNENSNIDIKYNVNASSNHARSTSINTSKE